MNTTSTRVSSPNSHGSDYAEFEAADFDTRAVVERMLVTSDITASLSRLHFSHANLQRQIKDHVTAHHESLLQAPLAGIAELERVQTAVQKDVAELTGAHAALKAKVSTPYLRYCELLRDLEVTQARCRAVRQVQVMQSLVKKLNHGLECGDFAVASRAVLKLESLCTPDIDESAVVKGIRERFSRLRVSLMQSLSDCLKAAVHSKSTVDIRMCLDTFKLLSSMDETLKSILNGAKQTVSSHVRDLLDLNALARKAVADDPSLQTAAGSISLSNLSKVFWNRIIPAFDTVFELVADMYGISQALLSYQHGAESVGLQPWVELFEHIIAVFTKDIATANSATPAMLQIMQGSGYHRLLRLIADWNGKLEAQFQHGDKVRFLEFMRRFLGCFAQFETAYLSRSLSRMFEPINSVFGANVRIVPSVTEIANISKVISAELDMAKFDAGLHALILKNAAKAVQLFFAKIETLLDNDKASFELFAPSAGLTKNLDLCNIIGNFLDSMGQHYTDESPLKPALDDGEALFDLVFKPMFRNGASSLIPLMLHLFSDAGIIDRKQTSLTDLEKLLFVMRKEVLNRLTNLKYVGPWVLALLQRIVILYTRVCSLIKPNSPAITSKMISDADKVIQCIRDVAKSAQMNLLTLSDSVADLEFFKKLSVMSLQEINSQTISRPAHLAMTAHMLFSRGPEDLKHPHNCFAMTKSEYIEWMDAHTFIEWKSMIEQSVNIYIGVADAKGDKEYAQEYVAIINLLKNMD
eukprot:Partr_v1_DN28586_c0_g1_i1_m73181 putative Component of oligomeric golgi complex 5